jgi:hypothetical protein
VWFHRLNTGSYLMLMAKRWYGGTLGSGGPQSYSAHTETTTPSVVTVEPSTGHASAVTDLATELSGDRIITGAYSRLDYLFTTGTIAGVPHVAHYRVTANGMLVLAAEELIPPVDIHDPPIDADNPVQPVIATVGFHAGCYIDGDYLIVFGTDADHQVYKARKNWGRIGVNPTNTQQWNYYTPKGWLADSMALHSNIDDMRALPSMVASGDVVSYAPFKDREYLSLLNGSNAEIWSSRRVEIGWTHEADVAATALWLQPQLNCPVAALPTGHIAAIPYVKTAVDDTSGAQSLQVAWGLHGV